MLALKLNNCARSDAGIVTVCCCAIGAVHKVAESKADANWNGNAERLIGEILPLEADK